MTAFPETELVDLLCLPEGYTLVGCGGARGFDVITPDGRYAAAGAAGLLDAARAARRHARGQLHAVCPSLPGRGDAESDGADTAGSGRPASDGEGPPTSVPTAADPAGHPAPAGEADVSETSGRRLAGRNGHPAPAPPPPRPAGPEGSDPAAAPPGVRVSAGPAGETVVSVAFGVHVGAVLAALAGAVPGGGRTARPAALAFGDGDAPRPAPGETGGPALPDARRRAAPPDTPARLAAVG
jgi:hypothetical protein